MSTFDYKSYLISVEQDVSQFFPGIESVRGIYAIWQTANGQLTRQIYRGHTDSTFKSGESAKMLAASENAARAWIDSNEGKPWM